MDAEIELVGNVDITVPIHGDGNRHVELVWTGARRTPLIDQSVRRIELFDAIACCVRHKDVSPSTDCHSSRQEVVPVRGLGSERPLSQIVSPGPESEEVACAHVGRVHPLIGAAAALVDGHTPEGVGRRHMKDSLPLRLGRRSTCRRGKAQSAERRGQNPDVFLTHDD